MKFLSVFTGIGAFDYGLEQAGMECVGQIEIEPFCRAVLEKHWPGLFRWSDVTDVPVELIRYVCGRIDCIIGGFACQDLSVAGKGAGLSRETRSGLTWRNLFRLIRGLRPAWLIIENVPALKTRGFKRVKSALERIYYNVRAVVVGAWACGASHKRDRVWIVGKLADAGNERCARIDPLLQRGRPLQDRIEASGCSTREMVNADALGNAARLGKREPSDQANPLTASRRARDESGNASGCIFPGGCWRCADIMANAEGSGRPGEGERRQAEFAGVGAAIAERESGVGQADASEPGPSGRRELSGGAGSQVTVSSSGCGDVRWPARPGEQQHEWEAPRLTQFSLGGTTDGAPLGLVPASDRDAETLARFQNKEALKALGNSGIWIIPMLIGKWIMQQSVPHPAKEVNRDG